MGIDSVGEARRRAAADWFARLNQTRVASQEVRAFSAWRRDPDNAAAYEAVERLWTAAGGLQDDPDVRAAGLVAKAPARPKRPRAWAIGPAAAGLLALVAGLGIWLARPGGYETAVGERRVVRLEDGSRVVLDTDSRIRARFEEGQRLVLLERGQARFVVRADPQRPFVVQAGDDLVTALGTRFDVRRLAGGVRVTLFEGKVAVADGPSRLWRLAPGEQIDTDRPAAAVAKVDVAQVGGWTSGRVSFDRTALGAAVAEVNRYSDAKLRLNAPQLAQAQVSGVFDAGDVDGFVAAVSDLYGLAPEQTGEGEILLSPTDRTPKGPSDRAAK